MNIRQVIVLDDDSRWLADMREGRETPPLSGRGPRLLAPLARMMG